MVLHVQYLVVLELIVVLMWMVQLNNIAGAVAGASLAKTGCIDRCGNVFIPYPFGMGKSSCYLDEWFEIDCRNNSKPFLKKARFEVLEVVLPNRYSTSFQGGTIRVNNPILMSSGCNATTTSREVANLTGSNFYFSDKVNTFTALGCNYRFEITTKDSLLIGCTTSCSSPNRICSAANETCCQSTFLNSQFRVFNATFRQIASGADQCAYAFIAEDAWLRSHPSTFSLQDLDYHVPAALEWGIYNYPDVNPQLCSAPYDESLILCYCDPGFEGNAFLPDGCTDINECEPPGHPIFCSDTCENIPGSYKCKISPTKLILIGLGSSFGLLILIASAWWLHRIIKKRNEIQRKKQCFKRNGGLLLEQQLSSGQAGNVDTAKVYSSEELEAATDHFNSNRILGHGGQGSVYKGMLPDGRIVAVKKSKIEDKGNLVEQFINEVMILSQVSHRNVVKLLGCCLETEVPLLVYEFVPNGTLFQYLHEQNDDEFVVVSWKMRLQIASEVAGALSYLHSAASIPIYHRDIKSTNILLDNAYRAKVADFGTSRSVALDQTHLTTLVNGTFGYIDPEYFHSSQFTDKSDVYSFGVVLVELLTGQKPVCLMRPEEYRSLVTYFITRMEEKCLFEIVDAPVTEEKDKKEEILAVANLAKKCLNSLGRNRPTMREVALELDRVSELSQKCPENYEEIEYETGEEEEEGNDLRPWNVVCSFTEYGMDSLYMASPNDAQPMLLLSSETGL